MLAKIQYILVFFTCFSLLRSQTLFVSGFIFDHKKQPVHGVSVKIKNSFSSSISDKAGFYKLIIERTPATIEFSHLGYEALIKNITNSSVDSLLLNVSLSEKVKMLAGVTIFSENKPETLVAKTDYSIYDFDFYEDKLILLASSGSLTRAEIQLSNYEGKIFSSYKLPLKAGEANSFFRDYEEYSELICKDSVFRIDVANTDLMIMPVKQTDFNKNIKPVADTLGKNFYLSDSWDKYPSMNYFYMRQQDTVAHLLKNISNHDLLKLYNLEYYYLPSRLQLEARRLADQYKTNRNVIGALLSGFTESMYYEPLYAPLFVINDTICIFDHYTDHLYHFDRKNKMIDSVKITYHHPKNWRDWKRKLIVDEREEKVYAYFSSDGRHYLKQINIQTGKEVLTYKLKHHSAEKIKIKDGYAYYVYRPFGSTQEKFLYREKIY